MSLYSRDNIGTGTWSLYPTETISHWILRLVSLTDLIAWLKGSVFVDPFQASGSCSSTWQPADSGMCTSASAAVDSFDADRFPGPKAYKGKTLREVCDHEFPSRSWGCFPDRNGFLTVSGDDLRNARIQP